MKNNKNNDKLLKFLGRVAIGAVASAVLTPPVALYLGSWTVFTGKCVEYMVEKEDKETFRFISDCGKDVATGGLFNCLVGTKSISIVSQETNKIGHLVSKEIAQNGMTDLAKELIVSGRVASDIQKSLKIADKTKDFLELFEPIKHKNHLDKGINYLESCEVCNV